MNLLYNKPLLMPKRQIVETIFVLSLMVAAAWLKGFLVQRNPAVTGDGLQYNSVVFNVIRGYGYRNLPNMTWLTEPVYGLLTYGMTFIVKDSELAGMLVY